jgi:hypothetical protein
VQDVLRALLRIIDAAREEADVKERA